MSKLFLHGMQRFIIFLIIIHEFVIPQNNEAENVEEAISSTSTESNKYHEDNLQTFTKCFDDIGCVNADENWFHKKFRPVNLKPLARQVIKTEFILIKENDTSTHNDIYYEVITTNADAIKSAGFLQGKFLFMMIHDFTSSGYAGWIKHITRVLKSRTRKCNVISVDWHAGAEPPYDQAIANARVVALEITNMLKFLKDHHELTLDQVHLIGHGVGAHIAGYVGYAHKTKKITGLDPNGPRFSGMPIQVRLDATDAHYVEVLHTDAMDYNSQGTMDIWGHTDFFINNADRQPGCPETQTSYDLLSVTRGMLNEGDILPGCSHKRAYKYYIESFEVEECTFLGIKCDSYLDFRQGKCTTCGDNCRTFGLVTYSEPNNGSYFLQTGSRQPYCLYQYRVTIQIKGTKSSYFGNFEFILMDNSHYATKSSMLDPREFKAGGENSFVFYAGVPEMGKIVDAKVGWKEKSSAFCLFNCKQAIDVEKISIQSINSNTKQSQEVLLCPKDGLTEIQNGDYQKFSLCK